MAEFFDMGGYAMYVWPSFGMTALAMILLLVQSLQNLKATQREFDRLKADLGGKGGDETDEA